MAHVLFGEESSVDDWMEQPVGRMPCFAHQGSRNPATRLVVEINRRHLKIAELVAPSLSEDVQDYAAYWSAVLGVSRYVAAQYVEIGMMLRRMPALSGALYGSGAIPMGHLSMLARHTRVVDEAVVGAVESDLINVVSPSREGEALRGVRAMRNRVQRVIDEHDPYARPRDIEVGGCGAAAGELPDMPKELADALSLAGVSLDSGSGGNEECESGDVAAGDLTAEQEALKRRVVQFFGDGVTVREGMYVDDRPGSDTVSISLELERPHSVELLSVVDAVADKQQVSRIEVLLALVRGEAEVSVNLDLYRVLVPGVDGSPADTPLWLSGAGWLAPLVTDDWLKRVSSIRVLGEVEASGYVPTEAQKSLVRARDGVCRFPGCEVPAEQCDIDHVEPYCHDDPSCGGKTVVSNLQCLCRRHHNLKTSTLWSAEMLTAGMVGWRRNGGSIPHGGDAGVFVTTPEGSLAESFAAQAGPGHCVENKPTIQFGRYTFEQQTVQESSMLKEHNEKRRQKHEELRDLIAEARIVADRVGGAAAIVRGWDSFASFLLSNLCYTNYVHIVRRVSQK